MTPLESIILGVVEGITEFLPVSSTGHLILASSILGIAQSNFHKSFEIIIQLGAISSVLMLYWRAFLDKETLKKIFVAFLPTAAIGFVFYSLIKTYLIGNEAVVLAALFLGGIALIAFELWHREKEEAAGDMRAITYRQSLMIGFAQAAAVIPGVSRSAATILGGLLVGLKRATIVEFSFLLAVPTMLAATGLDLVHNYGSFSANEAGTLALGFIASFAVALVAIKFLLAYVRTHTFIPFGIYRVAVALAFWIFVL